jgi:hypothetical protein
MQKRQTSAGLKESTCSAWRTRASNKGEPKHEQNRNQPRATAKLEGAHHPSQTCAPAPHSAQERSNDPGHTPSPERIWEPREGTNSQAARTHSAQLSRVHIGGGRRGSPQLDKPRMGRSETSGRREHARGAATPHHNQVAEDVGEAAPTHTVSLHPRERPVRHFTNEGQSAVTEVAKDSKEMGRREWPGQTWPRRYDGGTKDAAQWSGGKRTQEVAAPTGAAISCAGGDRSSYLLSTTTLNRCASQ